MITVKCITNKGRTEAFTGKKKGWFYFDGFTASAMLVVYNNLKPELQEKFDKIPLNKLVDFTWTHVKGVK